MRASLWLLITLKKYPSKPTFCHKILNFFIIYIRLLSSSWLKSCLNIIVWEIYEEHQA